MIGDLEAQLAARTRQILAAPRRAAVLVPMVDLGDGLGLLLTRRAETVGSHQGQVAFPGGRVEPDDLDLVATALREAHEEVNLAAAHVEVLGLLDDIPAATGHTMVTPVVGRVRGRPALQAQPEEVARIFTIPLRALQQKDRWRVSDISWRGQTWPMYFFDHDGETLWGLSAYVTLQLLAFLPGGSPYPRPSEIPTRRRLRTTAKDRTR